MEAVRESYPARKRNPKEACCCRIVSENVDADFKAKKKIKTQIWGSVWENPRMTADMESMKILIKLMLRNAKILIHFFFFYIFS